MTATFTINDTLLSQLSTLTAQPISDTHWWLLGTSGCHLCNQAEELLDLYSRVYPITWDKVDIIELPELMMQNIAIHIPILLTKNHTLAYPFTLIELEKLAVS